MNSRNLVGGLLLASLAALAQAQSAWPEKPVRIVVPYAPGGTTDYAARQIAQKLTEQTRQSFFVENKAGASGTIGTDLVAKSVPDGTTLLTNDTTYAMLPSLFARLPWDHANGLVPVTTIAQTPVVLVVGANSPFKTLQELVAHAQKHPAQLNFGSGGAGSSTHLAAELFKREGKVFITHIPYKGAGDAMLGVMSGQVDLLITASPTAIPQVKGGKVRALAVTGDKRLAGLPDVPTFREAGLPSYTVTNWFGLAAPKGTPPEVVARLQGEVKKALADPALRERFAQQGALPGGMAPADFASFIRQETQIWGAVARIAGVKPE
ncbi:Bug family tripartite tricarboxylate transporter substrate binding protein [Paenacidovorax monticola]|uniref:Tripartite tricarboxylate transporter substrate binding protein n=1 Tax=Paenacidovorax monticola TaxID=1926868 RepID=A0A7H0HBZ9_9BURK|nr:tripartite tricarboxylate transporter substrate binding protein [Paenacidovorax monticola]QNP58065.1 tripartite tricarboxylate transporter substrate binding protein [Paenacidovorax monticola]